MTYEVCKNSSHSTFPCADPDGEDSGDDLREVKGMKFSEVEAVRIPKGGVSKIRHNGDTLWNLQCARYVSLGDSIAAGHTINAEWATDYGEGSQYGKNGNTTTAIVPGCYTDLIRKSLAEEHSEKRATAVSFARSGDTVADLMEKLSHERVRSAIKDANLVTICIGANDVLQPAFSHLEEYISTGSLAGAEAVIASNMATLSSDSAATSYTSLLNKLAEINPYAKYVFTTIYNPYKYLYLEEGHNGFFGPLLNTIPQMNLDIDKYIEDMFFGGTDLSYWDILKGKWVAIELDIDLDALIKDGLLSVPIVQQLFDRVNGLSAWAEKYVTQLNTIIRDKVNGYQNPNFVVAETKALFDTYPDRPEPGDVHYNDLVSVEFTRGFDVSQADWGALWRGSNASDFWWNLAWKYLSFKNAAPSLNVWDYVSFDMNGFAADLVAQVIEKVITPDVDPHPEADGHKVLKQSFYSVR